MMFATGLPVGFKPCRDLGGYIMRPSTHLRLGLECEDLNPTAQTARRCALANSLGAVAPLICGRSLLRRLLEEAADPVDQVACPKGVPHDAIERVSYLLQVQGLTIQKVLSGLSVSDYRCNGLRHFRDDRGHQPYHRDDGVGVRRIDLRLAQGLRGPCQGVRECGIKILFSIVWRRARMSTVDHRALLHLQSGAQTAKACRRNNPQMINPLLERFDPVRTHLLFYVELASCGSTACNRRVEFNRPNLAHSESAIRAHFGK